MSKTPSWTNDQLIKIVPICTSFSEVAEVLGLSKSSNSALKKRAIELNIDYSHFRVSGRISTPLEKILILSNYVSISTHRLKLRLIKEGFLKKECYKCNLTDWNNKTIPLELEHINGNRCDNRIKNLTLLCPNCHAQTQTYRGKNKGKNTKNKCKNYSN
jgi:hypothetical protein